MNNKKWSVNILLCEECDENITNIKNIFDILYVDYKERLEASFDIVTIINAIKSDEKKFGLYYFIEKVKGQESQIAFLCHAIHKRTSEALKNSIGNNPKSTVEGVVFTTTRLKIRNCYFPGLGNYEIKVYKFDNDEAEEIENWDTEQCVKFAQEDHLVATYFFEVCMKNIT